MFLFLLYLTHKPGSNVVILSVVSFLVDTRVIDSNVAIETLKTCHKQIEPFFRWCYSVMLNLS